LTRQPEAVARFEREAVAAGKIDHPNVAKATDFGRLPDGSFYLVLEYVDGRTLSSLLGERELQVDEALAVARQISEALSAAHAAGIVHRDLKPDNVMLVARPGEPDLVKVLDFGIAKLGSVEAGSSSRVPLTRMGSVFGTPEYMAPEQAAGGEVDQRADLYALGILLYRLLAGREPFVDDDVAKVLMQQVTQAPPPLPLALHPEIRALVRDLLEKDPQKRLHSADEAYARIVYCTLQLGSATDVSWWSRLRTQFELLQLKGLGRSLAADTGEGPLSRFGVWCKRERDVGRLRVQNWHWLLGLLFLLLLVLGLLPGGAEQAEVTTQASPGKRLEGALAAAPNGSSAPPAPELIRQAIAGEASAIAALEQRPVSQRGSEEWLALARGRAQLGRFPSAIEAYQEVVLRSTAMSDNPEMTHDVWLAVQRADAAELALRFAARHLGARGADLLYKAWVDLSKSVTPTTKLAKELLDTPEVRAEASPALLAVMDLRAAEDCAAVAKQLPSVMLYGDARAVRVLRRAQNELECTAISADLDAAVRAVRARPEPVF
jgi:serine/threonine-protein kinase